MIRSGVAVAVLALVLSTVGLVDAADATARGVWPTSGQAAYAVGAGRVHVGPGAHVAPIASMAKVMTALLVLRAHPLPHGAPGFTMTVTRRDVRDYRIRVERDESTVAVHAGERLTERQALAALLLPSANNIAIMLARRVAGSVTAFVARMNGAARALSMRRTTYTDPSGFDARTRSTPRDQLVLARAAMRKLTLRRLVGRATYPVPYVSTVYSTDALLGHDGFVGIKTGSMDASGGCFMFLSHRRVRGRRVDLYGVVMGQPGADLISAGLGAARSLVDRVAPTPW